MERLLERCSLYERIGKKKLNSNCSIICYGLPVRQAFLKFPDSLPLIPPASAHSYSTLKNCSHVRKYKTVSVSADVFQKYHQANTSALS